MVVEQLMAWCQRRVSGTGWIEMWRAINRRAAARVVGLSVASAATEGLGLILLVPMLQALSGNEDQSSGLLPSVSFPRSIAVLLLLFIMLVSVRAILSLARQLATQQLQAELVDGLRTRAWGSLLQSDWRTLARMRQADSSSLLITNIDTVGYGLTQLTNSVAAAVTLVGIALAAFALSPLMSLLASSGGALILLAYRGMRRRAQILGEAHNRAYSLIHGEIAEGLSALRVIKTLDLENVFVARLKSHIVALRLSQRAFIRDVGFSQALLQIGGAGLLAAVVWIAVDVRQASVASVLPMVALFARALPLLDALQQAWQNASRSLPALGEALDLMRRAEVVKEPDIPADVLAPVARKSLRLEGVTVKHSDRSSPAINNVNLELRTGRIAAIIGPSGAGKSTVADVLSGLIAPDVGRLVIDGKAVDGVQRRAWRKRVAYIQQEPLLFTGSVRENLLLARPNATTEDLQEALARASAGFVEHLPGGIDAPLGERGLQLSGGERQRLALARGLLREPRLLILDEATSALDEQNEEVVAAAVKAMQTETAILIISHRGRLASMADDLIMMAEGRIVDEPPDGFKAQA